ncbi:MAG: SprT-like domain-containing protein [Bacteroidales bacterium]|nr:SprT-like domain-containing protein [Bacteroidales bacterium]
MGTYNEILNKYIPESAVNTIINWLERYNAELKITRARSTKLGDYRPPIRVKYHKISVNYDLNKYHFLITLVHEFAHLRVWDKHKNTVKPHGKEWKLQFREMMQPFLNSNTFPDDLLIVLGKYLKNPASSTSDHALLKVLRIYDGPKDYLTLEDLPMNSAFRIHNGFVFRKMEKLRKRYKCKRLDNNRMYLVSPLVKVVPVSA